MKQEADYVLSVGAFPLPSLLPAYGSISKLKVARFDRRISNMMG